MGSDLEKVLDDLEKIPGGYKYSGACSLQLCFPLKAGGELRFIISDDEPEWRVDLYDGSIPPGVTGPVSKTGQ